LLKCAFLDKRKTGLHALLPQSEWLTDSPWNRFILDRLTVAQLVKKLCTFYETRNVITVFTTARHWSLFSTKLIHSIIVVLPPSTYLFTAGVEVVYFHLVTLRHTPHSVALLWTRDRPAVETSTWQHKHSQETNIHAPGRIRTQDPSKRSAANLRLRPDGHSDRPVQLYRLINQPTAAQLVYNLQNVSAANIRPSAGRTVFRQQAAYDTSVIGSLFSHRPILWQALSYAKSLSAKTSVVILKLVLYKLAECE
jgi:hypothetical protein